ncbi:hypothetical protein EOL73_02805 [Candidatus Saccharibacteria bacterium]|nr:hypothetical protein [Candidatus Saccharibacteria bacterium]NCU40660.1 hypothetical protein [Candidatus Saccharibacteria bacterium]
MAGKVKSFQLSILSEKEIMYYGECNILFAPAFHGGDVAILPEHTPMIMKMGEGGVSMAISGQKTKVCEVKSGVLYVQDNEVIVLVNL